MTRLAARTDANHRELFDLAKQLGAEVIETFREGDGKPDGWVRHRFTVWFPGWFPVEIKTRTGRLTPAQEAFHNRYQVVIWQSREDVCRTLVVLK